MKRLAHSGCELSSQKRICIRESVENGSRAVGAISKQTGVLECFSAVDGAADDGFEGLFVAGVLHFADVAQSAICLQCEELLLESDKQGIALREGLARSRGGPVGQRLGRGCLLGRKGRKIRCQGRRALGAGEALWCDGGTAQEEGRDSGAAPIVQRAIADSARDMNG